MKFKLFLHIIFFLFMTAGTAQANHFIAIITSDSIRPYREAVKGFQTVVQDASIEYNLRGTLNDTEKIISNIKKKKPDFIYAVGTKAGIIAAQHFKNTPIMYTMISNPEKYGLVGKNIYGVTVNIPFEVQFGAMSLLMQNVKDIGVIYNPLHNKEKIKKAKKVINELGLNLITFEANTYKDIPKLLRKMLPQVDIVWLSMEETLLNKRTIQYIISTATKHKTPVISFSHEFLKNGALLAVKADYIDVGKQAGNLIHRMIIHKKKLTAHIYSPRRGTPIINMKVAQHIDLKIDKLLLELCEIYNNHR